MIKYLQLLYIYYYFNYYEYSLKVVLHLGNNFCKLQKTNNSIFFLSSVLRVALISSSALERQKTIFTILVP